LEKRQNQSTVSFFHGFTPLEFPPFAKKKQVKSSPQILWCTFPEYKYNSKYIQNKLFPQRGLISNFTSLWLYLLSMAPTAAMLLLSHNGKTHAPSSSSSSSATTYYSSLKASAFKWVAKYNPVPKARSENKRFEEALQLCSC